MNYFVFSNLRIWATGSLFAATSAAAAQPQSIAQTQPSDSFHIYTDVQRMPYLPIKDGPRLGKYGVIPFIHKVLRVPAEVRAGKVEGQILVEFAVGPSGVVKDAKIKQGLSSAVDAAVMKAMTRLPRFVPGQQNGQAVTVALTVPVYLWSPQHIYTQRDGASYPQFSTVGYPMGGGVGYNAYVRDNLHVPAAVQEQHLSGRVDVSFVVGADGRVRDAKLVKGLCASCDEEILRLVRAMPAWTPARNQQGEAVAIQQLFQISLPVPPPETVYQNKVYTYVEQMPEMLTGAGGNAAISVAIRERVVGGSACSGQVFVSFTVKADGTVDDAKILKGWNTGCDAAILAAVAKLPRFKPGRQNGQAVAVGFQVAVNFVPSTGK